MFKHILKKTLIAIATIWLIITISFTLVHTMPGDPIIFLIGEEEYYYLLDNNPAYLEQVTEKFGLNDDLPTQYARYMKSVLTLDFGLSYIQPEARHRKFPFRRVLDAAALRSDAHHLLHSRRGARHSRGHPPRRSV